MAPNKRNSKTVANLNRPGSPSKGDDTILSNKYTKLMHFGVWLVSKADISDESRNILFDKLYLFADIELRANFYEKFYETEKEIAKAVRKCISEKKKEKEKGKEKEKENGKEKEILAKGRDQILYHAFIDSIIEIFLVGRI